MLYQVWDITFLLHFWKASEAECNISYHISTWSLYATQQSVINAYITSSRLKRTPPIGAPKATLTPAAAAADSIYQTQTNASSIYVKYLKRPHDIDCGNVNHILVCNREHREWVMMDIRQQPTSLFLASFLSYLGNRWERMLPQQLAMWTNGPSLPRLKPADTDNIMPMDLTISVHLPR